ncbi:MAG: DivIVA domain-containing protein [Oscillospiraceae bacterium]|jgi:cell division initiation protein|nr:DivIVA domain-containing protein [Oscillospiraceae bacterium]
MLTPQEVRDRQFNTVLFKGYDAGEVSEFLKAVAEDYSALYKDNQALKSKLKVLADKVEEYRTTEEPMHKALLAAQKIADDLTEKAQEKYEEIVEGAEAAARERIENLKIDVRDQELRLEAAKKETAEFTFAAGQMVAKLDSFLKNINNLTFVTSQFPKPSDDAAAKRDTAKIVAAAATAQIARAEQEVKVQTAEIPTVPKPAEPTLSQNAEAAIAELNEMNEPDDSTKMFITNVQIDSENKYQITENK